MVKLTIDKVLSEKGLTRYWLSKKTEIKYQTIDTYYKNDIHRYDSYTLNKICEALNCDISDIIEYVPDKPPTAQEP